MTRLKKFCAHCGGRFKSVGIFCSPYCKKVASGLRRQVQWLHHEWRVCLHSVGTAAVIADDAGNKFVQVIVSQEKDSREKSCHC
jgi:hypothetical protein